MLEFGVMYAQGEQFANFMRYSRKCKCYSEALEGEEGFRSIKKKDVTTVMHIKQKQVGYSKLSIRVCMLCI